ncbi:ATP-binding cassette domain-containing protein, partial [Elizabethkingia anophelis]
RKKEVHTFSGGMRQRFGVAQALLGNPKIIIVDEPTAGLDPEERNRFNSLLNDISKDVIVILSTHLVEDVRNLCSEMAIMNKGQVLRKGKPNELIAELENKIWSKPIDKSELENYRNIYHIISQQLIERELYITTYSPERPKDFLSVNPLLEHVYFHTLTQKP